MFHLDYYRDYSGFGIRLESDFNFWKNDKEARKIAKNKIKEVIVRNNLVDEVRDWHISRIAGSLMSYLDIHKVRESNELLDELEVTITESEEIVLNLRGTSLNFNKKATWLGSLSAI